MFQRNLEGVRLKKNKVQIGSTGWFRYSDFTKNYQQFVVPHIKGKWHKEKLIHIRNCGLGALGNGSAVRGALALAEDPVWAQHSRGTAHRLHVPLVATKPIRSSAFCGHTNVCVSTFRHKDTHTQT